MRDKCRAQAEQFRTTLLHGLEKEGVLDKKMRRVIDQLILALRAPVGGGLRRDAQEPERSAAGSREHKYEERTKHESRGVLDRVKFQGPPCTE